LVLLNTGDGKGKSTAAFGVVMRAVARDWHVCVIQFIKSGKWKVGEEKIGLQLGVDWLKGGDGFTGKPVLVVFTVQVPPKTPFGDTIYLATDVSGWSATA